MQGFSTDSDGPALVAAVEHKFAARRPTTTTICLQSVYKELVITDQNGKVVDTPSSDSTKQLKSTDTEGYSSSLGGGAHI
jgi:hypothetical protein